MEKVNTTLIRAEMIGGEMKGAAIRGDRDEIMALLGGLVAMFLANNPGDRKVMREVLRWAFHDTRPHLGDVVKEKLDAWIKEKTE